MKFGFTVTRILVRGFNKKDAELDFSDDVTVVAGLSNTGKTYVFQCMKYLLGGGSAPKKIDESLGYDKAYLELKLRDGSHNTIYRSLSGGNALLYLCKVSDLDNYTDEPEVLLTGSKATQKNRTLSDYYSELSGFLGKKVRKNADGVTEKMGFALMRHLSVIDEVDIIKEGSPIIGGQVIHETKEKSFLKFLLTNEDDSSIVAKPKPNVVNNRKGKLEVVNGLLSEYREELQGYPEATCDELEQQIEKLEVAITEASSELSTLFESVEQVESTVNENWQKWKEKESRMLSIDELLLRFSLLAKHYETDMARLEAINEAGKAFTQLEVDNCPVCKSPFSEEHLCDVNNVDDVIVASESEMLKIQQLEKDLQFNIDSLYQERGELEEEIHFVKSLHKRAQESANLYRSVEIKSKVETIESYRVKLREVKFVKRLYEKVQKLVNQQKELQSEIDSGTGKYKFDSLSTSLLTDLSDSIKSLLNEWKYDEMKSVSFSEDSVDFVINGNERNLSGKGYRALTYSSFIIALLKYCVGNGRPHSGSVILDSPLCTLRSRHVETGDSTKDGGIIGDEMKDSFYSDLSGLSGQGQIIIFENDGPNPASSSHLKYHKFTKGKSPGRYGFFPEN